MSSVSNKQFFVTMMMKLTIAFALLVAACMAFQPPKAVVPAASMKNLKGKAAAPFAAALFSVVLATQPVSASAPVVESPTAAKISLNSVPPTSISVQIKDLPVVGKLASGIYSKLSDSSSSIKNPSIVIQSPSDKGKAIQEIVRTGHLEFDVTGVLNTHLDVDVAAEKAGIMNVRIVSDLIPKLPFQNSASFAGGNSPTGGKESPWNMVKNMGSGEVYYYNEKTGVTQYEKPKF